MTLIATACSNGPACALFVAGDTASEALFKHPSFDLTTEDFSSFQLGSLGAVPVYFVREPGESHAVVLRAGPVSVRYEPLGDNGSPLRVSLEDVGPEQAETIVESWAKDGRLFSPDERRAKTMEVQERCLLTTRLRLVLASSSSGVFRCKPSAQAGGRRRGSKPK